METKEENLSWALEREREGCDGEDWSFTVRINGGVGARNGAGIAIVTVVSRADLLFVVARDGGGSLYFLGLLLLGSILMKRCSCETTISPNEKIRSRLI
ncbi:hypothetical protein M0R45_025421 [Rubus argutus]|uniref:Uncharacterized protein n=1 Tax=Rubus argutus TaxID=59490 RepID=A0AAW1WUN1_RUBAR